MATAYEQGLHRLEGLIAWYKDHATDLSRNEATTRLHLIDSLLFECLGWDRSDCIAEERYEGQYTDYTMMAPHRLLILEAKKEGIYFELPLGLRQLVYDIKYFDRTAPDVHSAIQQAIQYCTSRGTPFGVVSNGHQTIAFLGSRTDGLPPLEGRASRGQSLR